MAWSAARCSPRSQCWQRLSLYVREAGSKELRSYAAKADALALSVVAYPEVRAAFARLKTHRVATDRRHRQRLPQLNADWVNLLRIELIPQVAHFPTGFQAQ